MAPLEVREQLACQQDWPGLLATWTTCIYEWAIVSTCHRFELYVVADSEGLESLCAQLHIMLSSVVTPVARRELPKDSEPWVVRVDEDAAIHLCRVAAGLDSLVLGEAQIQGQVIAAYITGQKERTIGPVLSSLFRTAIRAGKRARTETGISTHATSMSSVALNMAACYFPDFAQARVLVVGAGEMSRLALKALRLRQVTKVTVANRTLAHAQAALLHPEWRAIDLKQLPEALKRSDVIFSATNAVDPVITRNQMAEAHLTADTLHKQILIDLAVPRDIDATVRDLPGIVLVDVDDLRQELASLSKR
jgi:glutamyl-tRNA reductase